jgi:hypothetical protein
VTWAGQRRSTLALFGGRDANAHALAREFVTLDNFYVNAEVSYGPRLFNGRIRMTSSRRSG